MFANNKMRPETTSVFAVMRFPQFMDSRANQFCAKLSRFRTASSAHAPPDKRQASWRKKQQREQHDRVCARNRDSELDESMLSDKAQSDRGRQNCQDDRWPDEPQARDSAATPL
jgi:hypothetical protein